MSYPDGLPPGDPLFPPATPYGLSRVVVHLRRPPSLPEADVAPPLVYVDGHPVPVGWGSNPIPVPPGPHVVAVAADVLEAADRAELPVTVAPGETVEVHHTGARFGRQPERVDPADDPGGPRAGRSVVVVAVAVLVVAALLLAFVGNVLVALR